MQTFDMMFKGPTGKMGNWIWKKVVLASEALAEKEAELAEKQLTYQGVVDKYEICIEEKNKEIDTLKEKLKRHIELNNKILAEQQKQYAEITTLCAKVESLTMCLVGYFTAAEFENVEEMVTEKPPQFFQALGKIVAERTKALKEADHD